VSDAPFVIPARLGRKGLSLTVSHLLNTDEPLSFDFQIGDQLLRSPLHKFLSTYRYSSEEIVTIRYFIASQIIEDEGPTNELPAWISALDTSFSPTQCVAACYDGILRVVDNQSLEVVHEVSAHDEAIRAVAVWQPDTENETFVGTSSKDTSIKVWSFSNNPGSASGSLLTRLDSHLSSVEALCHWKQNLLLSGDWNGNMLVWDISGVLANKEIAGQEKAKDDMASKKRKTSASTANTASFEASELRPLFTLKAHSQAISRICVSGSKAYSSSWEHSVKLWDLERQDNTFTINCVKVVTDMSVQSTGGALIATSHPDGRVRVWDERRREGAAALGQPSDVAWVSSVKWHGQGAESENGALLLGSVDYSGRVNLWDLRHHTKPVASTEAHAGKVLCMDWVHKGKEGSNEAILSGGSDCSIRATTVKV
jgi:ribosome biogenesis protein YTM1